MVGENCWDFVLFLADEQEQEQYDNLKADYMQDVDRCISYYGEDIEQAVKALKMIVNNINSNGHDVKICDLIDIF